MAEEINKPKPESPLTLYNMQTGQPETLRPGEAEQAILRGTHSVPKGARVNLVDQDGNAGGIDSSQLRDALSQGFRLETPFEKVVNDYVEENEGIGGELKAGINAAVNELGFGVPDIVEREFGDPLEFAKKQKLAEERELGTILGTVAGVGGSLVTGGPLFRAATKAGSLAARGTEKALENALTRAGVESSKTIAQQLAPKLTRTVVSGAAEGAVAVAPRVLTEAAIGDTELAAEALVLGAGVGGLLGGTIAAASPVLRGINGIYKTGKNAVTSRLGLGADDLVNKAAIAESGTPRLAKQDFEIDRKMAEKLQNVRARDYDQIIADAKILGIPPEQLTYDVLTDNQFIKNRVGAMSTTPRPVGVKYRQQIADNGEKVIDAIQQSLGRIEKESVEQVAKQVKEQADTVIREGLDAANALYNKRAQEFSLIKLSDDEALSIYDQSQKLIRDRVGKLNASTRVKDDVLDEVTKFSDFTSDDMSLETLFNGRKKLREQKNFLFRTGSPEKLEAARIVDELDTLITKRIEDTLEARARDLPVEAQAIPEVKNLMDIARGADAEYRALKANQKTVAEALGWKAGVRKTPGQFLEELTNMSDTALFSKLSNIDARLLKNLDAVAPEMANVVKAVRRNSLVRQTGKGEFGVSSTLKRYKEMDSALKDVIFTAEEKARLDAASRLWSRMELNFNKSNSATALQFAGGQRWVDKILDETIGLGTDFAFDKSLQQALKSGEAVESTVKMLKTTGQILDATDEAVTQVLTNTVPKIQSQRVKVGSVLSRSLMESGPKAKKSAESDEGDPQKLLKDWADRAAEVVMNTENGLNRLDDLFSGLADMGVPETAAQAQGKAVGAMTYLVDQLPTLLSPVNDFSADQLPRVPLSEISAFERRLETVMNPGVVAQRLKDGTLTRENVETMAAVYPRLYNIMRERAMQSIATNGMKASSYQARLKLGLLLSLDTHYSLSSHALQALQTTPARMAEAQAQGQVPGRPNALTLANRQMTQDQRLQNS